MPENPVQSLLEQPEELWLVSAPEITTSNLTKNLQNQKLLDQVKLTKFNVPDLRVGTLDQLMQLADELTRTETQTEQLGKRLATYIADIMTSSDGQRDRGTDLDQATFSKVQDTLKMKGRDYIHEYARKFTWEQAQYPFKGILLKDLHETFQEKLNTITADFVKKSTAFNVLRRDLAAVQKKQTGTLLTRDLSTIVKEKEHLVCGSEIFQTLLVVVPKQLKDAWLSQYATLTEFVVPQSSQQICVMDDYILFNVTLFQRVVDEFRTKAATKKFVVREFKDVTKQAMDKNAASPAGAEETLQEQVDRLKLDINKQFRSLLRWLQVQYATTVSLVLHLKCMKCFTESVLRYGVPAKFEAVLLTPSHKYNYKLNEVLDATFKHLDRAGENKDEQLDTEGLNVNVTSHLSDDYKPYFFAALPCDFIHHALGLQ